MNPLLLGIALAAPTVAPICVDPNGVTALHAVDARRTAGLEPFQPCDHARFFVSGWTRPDQSASWLVSAPAAADHAARVVLRRRGGGPLEITLACGSHAVRATLEAAAEGWQRLPLAGLLPLGVDPSELTLTVHSNAADRPFTVDVQAVEVFPPDVARALHERAVAFRADTAWLRAARFGVMVHWTSESMPLRGDPLPYANAVEAFDVDAFADRMHRTGAGFVVFTTSHARQFFPAPLAALDRVIPGRTARRDLVADLAAALGRRDVKLMLYYHLGSHADPEWLAASRFRDRDSSRFFDTWQAIVREAGERYGDRLAGWWFDDGAVTYYPRNPPWEDLARAARSGHPGRLVCFNPWELASPTEFQDLCAGEGCRDPRGFGGLLVRDGDGRYPVGVHAGLQSTACLVFESVWVHGRRDTPPGPPSWTEPEVRRLLGEFAAYRNVPIFNLEITQEGIVSDRSVDVLAVAARETPSHP